MNFNNPIISGNTDGTPITHLRQDIVQKINNEMNDNESHYSIESIKTTTDIKELVDEINKDIKKKNKSKSKNTDEEDREDREDREISNNSEKTKNKKKKKYNKKDTFLEDTLYDGILLLIIYLLMSQGFVKNFLGKYIKVINVNEEGIVPFLGVFTYGFIFVVVFLSIRFAIHKIS